MTPLEIRPVRDDEIEAVIALWIAASLNIFAA